MSRPATRDWATNAGPGGRKGPGGGAVGQGDTRSLIMAKPALAFGYAMALPSNRAIVAMVLRRCEN